MLLQSGLDKEWWADSMECYCYLRNIQDLLSDGKTPYERRFGMPFKGPVNRLDQWSNITVSLRKTYLDCISLEQKSCQEYSSVMYCTRGESEKETLWSQTLMNWRRWTYQNSRQKAQCTGSVNAAKK